jgi:CubicO group peptidase (beta-lactamase class C family)
VAAQEAANPLDGIYERMGVTIHSALGPAPLSTTLAQFVDKLAECPLMYQPGEKWHYSLATDVCGMLVEAISGMSFWEFLRTRLFVPLGMLDTFFVIPPEKADRQADVYRPGWGADGSDTAPSPTAAMTSIVNISGHDGQDFSTPHVYLIRTALVYSSLCLSRIH